MSKSGSEKRQRTVKKSYRFTPEEAAELRARAAAAGLSEGAFIRRACLDVPPPKNARLPVVHGEEIRRLLAQLGKIGSNLNQLARAANRGVIVINRQLYEAACIALIEIRQACLKALGKKP